MNPAFPKYVVLQSKSNMKYLAVEEDADGDNKYGGVCSILGATGDQVRSPLSKFKLEKAKIRKRLFNMHCCYNNKYVVMKDAGDSSSYIVAGAAEPNEDPSQRSSTLVEVVVHAAGNLTTVQFRFVYNRALLAIGGGDGIGGPETHFTVFNWESLMNLPEYVVLKGDNGKYLKVAGSELRCDGNDIGDLALVHQVLPAGDGTITMKPMLQPFPWEIHWQEWLMGRRIIIGYQSSRFMPVKAGSNSI